MFGAIPRLFCNWSKRVRPSSAYRMMRMLHHSPTCSRLHAIGHTMRPQLFHLDEAAARSSLFGELVASGWHTAAITMRLLVESCLPIAGGVIGSGGEISWTKPTRPGDTLTVVSEIEQIIPSRSRPERG